VPPKPTSFGPADDPAPGLEVRYEGKPAAVLGWRPLCAGACPRTEWLAAIRGIDLPGGSSRRGRRHRYPVATEAARETEAVLTDVVVLLLTAGSAVARGHDQVRDLAPEGSVWASVAPGFGRLKEEIGRIHQPEIVPRRGHRRRGGHGPQDALVSCRRQEMTGVGLKRDPPGRPCPGATSTVPRRRGSRCGPGADL